MAALDHDIEKLLPAALYKKGFDLCAAFSTKAYNDTTSNKKLHDFGRRNGALAFAVGSSKHIWQYFLRCEPRSAWPDHPNNSRGLNAFDSFVEEAVLEAVDDAELHRRTQRFYEFAHQGDYKFMDIEKLKETHFIKGQRQTLHEDCLPGCKSINGYLSSMGHHPKCPHAKEPIQRPTGDLPDVWDDQPGDAVDFRACAAHAGLVEILPGGLCAHKKFGPWVSIRAIIVVDADPPSDILPPVRGLVDDDVGGLAEDALEADPDDWDAWLRIYKEIERGREHKFGEAQLLYRFAGPFRDQALRRGLQLQLC